jgi:hypothetical protein
MIDITRIDKSRPYVIYDIPSGKEAQELNKKLGLNMIIPNFYQKCWIRFLSKEDQGCANYVVFFEEFSEIFDEEARSAYNYYEYSDLFTPTNFENTKEETFIKRTKVITLKIND